jgi:hypothetical protein
MARSVPGTQPNRLCQNEARTTSQTTCLVALSGEGEGLNAAPPSPFGEVKRKCLCPVYLHERGEVAERLKAAVC